MSAVIAIPGGRITVNWVALADPTALFNVPSPARFEFEYAGRIPVDLLVELVRRSGGGTEYCVNGVPLATWLERVSADRPGS